MPPQLQIKRDDDKWVRFYPLNNKDALVNIKDMDDLPEYTYGKYVYGAVGNGIAWAYVHAERDRIRVLIG